MCLDTAQSLRAVYFQSHYRTSHRTISVNSLLQIVQNTYHKKVILSFHEDSHKSHHLYSFLHVDEDGNYNICLMSEMTNCWNRFALCKELFHVILDEESTRNPSIKDHLQDYRAALTDSEASGRDSSKSEILTEYAAMQYLFPYAKRLVSLEEIDTRVSAGEARKVVFLDVAEKLMVPRLMVEDYLGTELMDLFDAISWIEKSDGR